MPAGAHLLLVEDSDTQALQFRLLMDAHGVTVDRAASAEEALEMLNARRPDAMVVDFQLPGMNGDDLVRIVRQNGRTATLPILMLTDALAPEVERHGLDSGADAYVPKSGDRDTLVARLRALLRRGRDAASHASAGFRQPTVLVVDESATQRLYLEHLLTADGYLVRQSTTAEAEAIVAADPVDCILIGLDSHDREAVDLIRRLDRRRDEPGARHEIVGLGGAAAVPAGFEAGADEVLPRGDDPAMLIVRLRALVRRKLARDDEASRAAELRTRDQALARARAEAESAEALAAANTELAAANRRLEETQGQLVQAAKMASLGELVAGIAHEINNPLAFILAHRETVARKIDQARRGDAGALDRAADRLESMKAGLVRIQDLVVKLRRFSRLEEGEPTTIDVPQALDEVIALLHPKLGDSVTLTRDYAAPAALVTSPALINQVVMNILSNAADVVRPGTGRIAVSTRIDRGQYVIEVADDGPGIAAAERARVFEPFFTTKDVGKGTGLGLAIAYGVVRSQGGEITIGASIWNGALFTVSVPCNRGT